MKSEKETFEHSNELNGDKLVFYIKDSFQKHRLDYNLKVAEEKSGIIVLSTLNMNTS